VNLEHQGVPRFEDGFCIFEEGGEFSLGPLISADGHEHIEASETGLQRVDRAPPEGRAQGPRHDLGVRYGPGGITVRHERRCDHPMGTEHCGMEFTEHSHSIGEERLEEFEAFLE
jgi:hypothetical protein